MFSSLRQNSVIYILDKTDRPKLIIGQVVSVSAPQQKFNNIYNQEYVVDITAKTDDGNVDFKQIPSIASIANFGTMVISETKDAMMSEVEGMMRNSQSILDSVEKHKEVVVACNELMKDLNPQFAKDQEREERLGSLEKKFDGIETILEDIKTMLYKGLDTKTK